MTKAPEEPEWLWEASRYLCGELSPAEAAEFEATLEESPAACEALTEAVQLHDAVAACEDDASRDISRRRAGAFGDHRRRPIRIVAWGTAAALLVIAAAILFRPSIRELSQRPSGGPSGPDATAQQSPATLASAGSVLTVWAALGEADADSNPALAIEEDEARDSLDEGADVPEWMFSALLAVGPSERLPAEMDGVDSPVNGNSEEPL